MSVDRAAGPRAIVYRGAMRQLNSCTAIRSMAPTVERRFVWQARTAVIVVALPGIYMIGRLNPWDRFQTVTFW